MHFKSQFIHVQCVLLLTNTLVTYVFALYCNLCEITTGKPTAKEHGDSVLNAKECQIDY